MYGWELCHVLGLLMLCIRGWGDSDDGNGLLLFLIRGGSECDLEWGGLLLFCWNEGGWMGMCVFL